MVASNVTQVRLLDRLRQAQGSRRAGGPDLRAELDAAIARAGAETAAWRQVRQEWVDLRGLPSSESDSRVLLHAADLVQRLMALAEWQGNSQSPREVPPTRTSRKPVSLEWHPRQLLEALNELQAVSQQLATDHARFSTTLGRNGLLFVQTRTLDDGVDEPRIWSPAPLHHIGRLTESYRAIGLSVEGHPLPSPDPACASRDQPGRNMETATVGQSL